MSSSLLLTVSLLFSFAAYPAYAYKIYRDEARPTRPTWIMILVSDLLLFCFMLMEARWDWLLLGFTAGNTMMLALMAYSDIRDAKRHPTPKSQSRREHLRLAVLGRDPWTKKDVYSVAVALGALGLWAATGSGVYAICFSLAGKIAASLPMWVNLYKDPRREAMLPWILWATGGALYIFAIPQAKWGFVSLAMPIVFLILECIVLGLLMRRFANGTDELAHS